MKTPTNPKLRIESIDILRGIVMLLMALDHVRDYFHIAAFTDSPLNLETTTPFLYFTRWITHFCAPVFIFLSGTSVYLQSLRKTKKELSSFLIKRGFWLIFVEVIIISLGWTFNPFYNAIFLQVIWAIGISMVLLGLLIQLQFKFVFIIGLLIVFGHNLLDIPESVAGFKGGFWLDLIHSGKFTGYSFMENHSVFIVYPFLPWTGLMIMGYCTGLWFTQKYTVQTRRKYLLITGSGLILFFIALRFLNSYGDPVAWSLQKNSLLSFFSFMDVNKYPPSLLYMCITIGTALLFLAFIEQIKNGFTNALSIYGRVAFFYYVLHFYVIHLFATIAFLMRGHTFAEGTDASKGMFFFFVAPGEGYNLTIVYIVWIILILSLYPLCKWYDAYKTKHKEKWWLSYL